jgi:hypothetical protein
MSQTEPFSDALIARVMSRYPPATEISPAEFEAFVTDVLRAAGEKTGSFAIEMHQTVQTPDGSYDFDAVATYQVLGLQHTLLVEAKRHRNPIKRELVQVLHSKLQSVGAQKALLIAAGPFQSGAIEYALAHGIALATLSEGRLTMETHSASKPPPMTQARADELGIERYAATVNHRHTDGKIHGFRLSNGYPHLLIDWITGRDAV